MPGSLLFDMGEYTVTALTEQALFHQLLERFAPTLLAVTEEVARRLPGRLWRIYGPEFAAAPYLPPALFREYVCRYDKPMVDIIHGTGGYARVHSHGRLKGVLDDIVARWGPMPWIRSSRRRKATSSLLTCASNTENKWCCSATWK